MPLAEVGAELLFQVIADRAERTAVIITTNLPFSEWPQVFPNARLCKAMLDRLTDRAHIIETGTESFRFRRTIAGKRVGKVPRQRFLKVGPPLRPNRAANPTAQGFAPAAFRNNMEQQMRTFVQSGAK